MKMTYVLLNEEGVPSTHDGERITIPKELINHDMYKNIAVIVQKSYIVIDVDNHNVDNVTPIKKIIEHFKIKTHTVITERGMHLYFKRPKGIKIKSGSQVCKIGVELEYKTSNMQVTVKKNGKIRHIENAGKFIELPNYLLQHSNFPNKSAVGLKDGNGRHDYLLRSSPEFREIINSIVFGEPVPKEVIDNMSSGPNLEYRNEKGFINLNRFALFMIKRLSMQKVNEFMFYKLPHEDSWSSPEVIGVEELHRYIIEIEDSLSLNQRVEVIKTIYQLVNRTEVDEFPVHIQNKTLHDGQILEPEKYIPTPFMLDNLRYEPDAYDKYTDEFLRMISVHNGEFAEDIYNGLLDILGHIFITRFKGDNAKFFILTGDGKNGKSTFQNMVRNLLPNTAKSDVKLRQFEKETTLVGIVAKLLNSGDDLDNAKFKGSGTLKTICTSDPITLDVKYRDPITNFRNSSTIIFSANEPPIMDDQSGGIERRLCLIPFNLRLKSDEIDYSIESKLKSENAQLYLTKLAVERYVKVSTQGVTNSELLAMAKREQLMENCSVMKYLSLIALEDNNINVSNIQKLLDGKESGVVYSSYVNFCESDGVRVTPKHNSSFGKLLKTHCKNQFGILLESEAKNGKRKYKTSILE